MPMNQWARYDVRKLDGRFHFDRLQRKASRFVECSGEYRDAQGMQKIRFLQRDAWEQDNGCGRYKTAKSDIVKIL